MAQFSGRVSFAANCGCTDTATSDADTDKGSNVIGGCRPIRLNQQKLYTSDRLSIRSSLTNLD